jgi:hypothetical protein
MQGNLLDPYEQWQRVLPRATATGGALAHALPPMKVTEPVDRGLLPLLYLLMPAVKVTVACNKGNNTQQQLILILLFCRSASLVWFFFSVRCSFLLPQWKICCRGADRSAAFVLMGRRSPGLWGWRLVVRLCRLLELGERLEEVCPLLSLCSCWSGESRRRRWLASVEKTPLQGWWGGDEEDGGGCCRRPVCGRLVMGSPSSPLFRLADRVCVEELLLGCSV